ncbi:hypothetical protein PG614_08155 [Riemerella anatipestifer]|nr:hypothetical protein [Riemerella anatipestifer]MDY3533836.1 hypothetical protein [Riemerella anatipestifer]MDY3535920.1 hypothetical protein [Riemerella anatipestifer]
METTITKLSVFAFLGLGLAAYGQKGLYDGKVGLNTDKPAATLEIKGKSTNSTDTLEGLIIPNVSKNKALQMGGNSNIKESTLIYVNDLTDYNVTPADAKVEDITEKGYYYWDGTKWVKTKVSASSLEPWYDKATNTHATSNTQNIYQLGNIAVGFPYNIPSIGIIGRNQVASVGLGNGADAILSVLGSRNTSVYTTTNYGDVEPFIKKWSDTGQIDASLLTYNPKDRLLGDFLGFDYKSVYDTADGRGGAGFRIFVDGDITLTSKPSRIEFVTTANGEIVSKTRMIIKNDGKVGIGTTTPTEKLEVAGNVKANTFIATQTGSFFPDYVFQKYYTGTSSLKADYNFKTLSQVEDFVKANGHLPGYLSASKIKEQGYIDLMATQLTNVEKIEELYLHSIEQDKALKAKDAEIKELKERLSKIEALLSK